MNRREWKKARLTDTQLKRRKITVTAVSVSVLLIAALIVVFLFIRKDPVPNTGDWAESAAEEPATAGTSDAEISDAGLVDKAETDGIKTDPPGIWETDTDSSDEEEDPDLKFDPKAWKKEHTKVYGVYLTGPVAGSERLSEILDLIDNSELNAVVLDIKNDEGNITFKMESGTPADIDACVGYIRDMEALMKTFDEHNIYTIARIACFKDPVLASKRPELALVSTDGRAVTDGEGLAWVNPCSEDVWEYLIEIAEICADLGFDEIQYDYVRFPVGDTAENADYGTELTAADKHIYIEGFLKKASERLHEKNTPVTADVFGTVIGNPVDVEMVGQDYRALAECVDVLCPMVYPSHYGNNVFGLPVPDAAPYDTVYAALTDSADELSDIPEEDRAVIRPWLQAFTATWISGHISYGPEEIYEQIRAVEDAGYDEWILWNAKNNYPESVNYSEYVASMVEKE